MTRRDTRWLLGLGLLVGLLMAPAAQAIEPIDFNTGMELLAACRVAVQAHAAERIRDAAEGYRAGLCDGYVFGMVAMALDEGINAAARGLPPSYFCYPTPSWIQLEPVERVIVRYLESHPERLHLDRNTLFIEALRQAFPCPAPATQPTRQRANHPGPLLGPPAPQGGCGIGRAPAPAPRLVNGTPPVPLMQENAWLPEADRDSTLTPKPGGASANAASGTRPRAMSLRPRRLARMSRTWLPSWPRGSVLAASWPTRPGRIPIKRPAPARIATTPR